MNNDSLTHWFDSAGHLTNEAFGALVDGDVDPRVEDARQHLAICADCTRHFAELQVTVNLLRALPNPVPARSFQIEVPVPAEATPEPRPFAPRLTDRVRNWMLPALPALRAVTLGVFLLFLSVTAGDIWTTRDANRDSSDIATGTAVATQPVAQAAPTQGLAASETEAGESAGRSAQPVETTSNLESAALALSAETSAAGEADSAAAPADSVAVADSAANESAPAAAPAMAVEQEEAPAPETAEIVDATPESVSDRDQTSPQVDSDEWSAWRTAQGILLLLFAILLLLVGWLRWGNRSTQ